jgi:pimeloyl-ACP methyl ester carboxylesterase
VLECELLSSILSPLLLQYISEAIVLQSLQSTADAVFFAAMRNALLLALYGLLLVRPSLLYQTPVPPKISPATGLPNLLYKWRQGQQVRYQVAGPIDGEPLVMVHGLFVNSDHWRKTLRACADQGYRTYALDLFGCGYSDKPARDSDVAQKCNGENGRFDNDTNSCNPSILRNVELGTANGVDVRIKDIDLRHPLRSPYNFYTWSEQITDFCRDVIVNDIHMDVTIVCNSIGTVSSLQAVIDAPDLYKGVFVISPNFRELHSAEVPLPSFSMPVVRRVQSLLRAYGQYAFDALAKPKTVKQILKEPYVVTEAVDDVLVKVLLDPLLTDGASDVVFDTLSYSAGPLPEQQLSSFPKNKPVWVCYGKADPWTPGLRVEALTRLGPVERVEGWEAVGHCPMDECPEKVNPLLFRFLERLQKKDDDMTFQISAG